MTVDVDPDDLRVVLGELERSGPVPPVVAGAVRRLRDACDPPMFGDGLSDPGAAVRPPAGRSDTSKRAAFELMPKSGTQRQRVLLAVARAGGRGVTDDELEDVLGLRHPSPGARRTELVAGGWVRDSGQRRPTRRGQPATVWVLTDAGRARLHGQVQAS